MQLLLFTVNVKHKRRNKKGYIVTLICGVHVNQKIFLRKWNWFETFKWNSLIIARKRPVFNWVACDQKYRKIFKWSQKRRCKWQIELLVQVLEHRNRVQNKRNKWGKPKASKITGNPKKTKRGTTVRRRVDWCTARCIGQCKGQHFGGRLGWDRIHCHYQFPLLCLFFMCAFLPQFSCWQVNFFLFDADVTWLPGSASPYGYFRHSVLNFLPLILSLLSILFWARVTTDKDRLIDRLTKMKYFLVLTKRQQQQ